MVKINSSKEGLLLNLVQSQAFLDGRFEITVLAVSQKIQRAMNFPFFVERKSGYEIYHQARRGNSWFVFRKKYDLVNNLRSLVDTFLFHRSNKILK